MDSLATVLLRRTSRVTVTATGTAPADGAAWVTALEADLAQRGWLLRDDLRAAAARLPATVRVRWADWLMATVDELTGADRPMVPLYRSFPDTPHDVEAEYVRRLLTHLFAVPGAPCVLCGSEDGGAPLDPCGHLVCRACFPPERFSACPICGRRLAAGNTYLTVVAPAAHPRRPAVPTPELPMRLAGLEADPAGAAARLRDDLVARPAALSEADRADLRALIAATVPGRLDWLPEVVPARETQALVIADALHAAALTPGYPEVVDAARRRWTTATDAARTLWAYSGGDPGLELPRAVDESGRPGAGWRPAGEPAVTVPVARVRALPRPLRRAVLAHLDACGAVTAAEDMRRHTAVWKRLGERLHPYEKAAAHPGAAVAFAVLRQTRTARTGPLGAAVVAACARHPRHLALTEHPDGTVAVRLRTHAALVERALDGGDVAGAAALLTERPGDLWRRVDHLLRAAGADRAAHAAVETALRRTATRVAPGVLAAAAAQLTGRAETVRATPAQLAAVARARAAALALTRGRAAAARPGLGGGMRDALRRAAGGSWAEPAAEAPPSPAAADGERPGPGMPRRVFFPSGGVATTWTEPERRPPLPAAAISTVRDLVDGELARRAARLDRFDVAVLDAGLADVPAPMRVRAASAQLAGWPRGSVRTLPGAAVVRLFLHWQDAGADRVDLDLSCVFFDQGWRRAGHCDYTNLRFAGDGAVHSGDLTSAPPPLGATEFLDLNLDRLAASGAHYAVPVVFSFNAVPFEALSEAFAGLMLPPAGGEQFDGARVAQRFDLRGNTRTLMPMVVDLRSGRLLWTDLSVTGHGYGHSVDRHQDQLARAAADQWEVFVGGHRATLLDLLAWQAAGRADRILVAHTDGTYSELPPAAALPPATSQLPASSQPPAASEAPAEAGSVRVVAAMRAVAATGTGDARAPHDLAGRRVLAGAVDLAALDRMIPVGAAGAVGAGSVAMTVTGIPAEPWTAIHADDLLGQLVPDPL